MSPFKPVQIGSLAESAVLVSLNISQWTARRFDKAASADVTGRNGAVSSAARVNKLLIGKAHTEALQSAASEARATHDRLTLPWGARGQAILAACGFLKYREAMSPLRQRFEDAAAKFCADYPALRDAARKDLGELFNADDYPAPEEITRRFAFALSFSPVPEKGDFRVDIPSDALAEIRAEVEASTKAAAVDAVQDVYRRVSDVCRAMSDKLAGYKPGNDGERAQGIFRDSLVGNVRELADVLPALNL